MIHIPVRSKYFLNIARYFWFDFSGGLIEMIRLKYLYIRHVNVASNVNQWRVLNPEHRVILYDESDRRHMIATELPQFLALYDALYTTVERLDFWRYAALYLHGGLYADSDVNPFLPIEAFGSCVPEHVSQPLTMMLFKEVGQSTETAWQFHIGVLYGRKMHAVWLKTMERVLANVRSELEAGKILFESVLERTGSGAFTPIVNEYFGLRGYLTTNDSVAGDAFIEAHDRVVGGPLAKHFMVGFWRGDHQAEAMKGFQRALKLYREKKLQL
jgi:hypothetical protein